MRMDAYAQYRSEPETPGQIQQIVRLRIKSGSATSGPPIGPVLGQYAIPISKFCTEFNERTSEIFNDEVEVFVTLYQYVDGSYTFELAIPISSICFRRAVFLKRGSGYTYGPHRRGNYINSAGRGIMSPYMLYEILVYRADCTGGRGHYTMQAVFSKGVGTLSSMGISLYTYMNLLHNVTK